MWKNVLDQIPNFASMEPIFHSDIHDSERVILMLSIFYDDMNFDIWNRPSGGLSARNQIRGNSYYKQKARNNARKNYNEAGGQQTTGETQSLEFAFNNRSAFVYLICKHDYCYGDVARAMGTGYDDSLNSKLENINSSDEAVKASILPFVKEHFDSIIFKIDSLNPRIICADRKIDLAYSDEFGRYVVAIEDIEAGAILSVEEPYVTAPSMDGFKDRCNGCLKHCTNLIPCTDCSSIQYCSELCKKSDAIHAFECTFIDFFNSGEYSPIVLLTVRAIIKARLEVNSWDELVNSVNGMDIDKDPLHRGFVKVDGQHNPMNDMPGPSSAPSREQFQYNEKNYDHRRYSSIYTMFTQEIPEIDENQKCYAAAQILRILRRHMPLFRNNNTETDQAINEEIVARLIHRHLTIIESNHCAYPLRDCDYMGIYPFTNMYNHSCTPNARLLKNGTNSVIYALAPIKKGKQIFISYGPEYTVHDYCHRILWLNHYKVSCYCNACVNQWQTFKQMPCNYLQTPEGQDYFKNVMSKDEIHMINIGNNKVLWEVLIRMFKHISKLDLSQSNFEYFKYETIITMFMILAGKTSKNDDFE